jgi:hypothetical protein
MGKRRMPVAFVAGGIGMDRTDQFYLPPRHYVFIDYFSINSAQVV